MSPAQARSSDFLLISAFFERHPDAMLLSDAESTIVAANQAAAELLGVAAGQLIGKRVEQVLEQRLSPGEHGKRWRCTVESRHGKQRMLEVSGSPLGETPRGVYGWALSLRLIDHAAEPPKFVGRSAVVQEMLEFVSRIAASRAHSILLTGESGTGKELIAKRLHCLSGRAAATFVPINCAAVPAALLESELFGHERGAFTGAAERREGLLEAAHRGTVFLDEIGEMPLAVQAKLLRVLEDRTFRRVGGSIPITVDVRIIAATNADLEKAIEEERFRKDLYYRLNVVQIRLPALRERPGDIPALALHFLDHFNRVHGRTLSGIAAGAQDILTAYTWPGNVRELRNVIERAVLVERSCLLTPASLSIRSLWSGPNPAHATVPHTFDSRLSLRSSEHELIAAALAETGGNQSRAATLLGIGRYGLRYRMKKLGMR